MVTEKKIRSVLIGTSLLVSVLLITLAYANSGPSFFSAKSAGAESTHDLLVSYASKDSDGDGLPDWEEALYGTDPNNAHSVNPSMSDADAVNQGLIKAKFDSATTTPINTKTLPGVDAAPSTLTDQFSKQLFGEYLKARAQTGKDPSNSDISAFVAANVASLEKSQATQDAFNAGQVHVSGTGPDALLAYAAGAEKIILKVDSGKSQDEVGYFSDAVYKNDPKAAAALKKYSADYAAAAHALMQLPVPQELATSHLALANDLMKVSTALANMSAIQTDPVRSMLGMSEYTKSSADGREALRTMGQVFSTENAVPAEGSSGSVFYRYLSIKNTK